MTDDFLKRLNEANQKAVKRYKDTCQEYENKCKENERYVEMYLKLVLLFVELFDYEKGLFNIDSNINYIKSNLSEVIGQPRNISSMINTEKKEAFIYLYYDREYLELLGLPKFIAEEKIDFNIVNNMLSENGISVKADLWDGGERGLDAYIIKFDASILISTQEELNEKTRRR